MCGTDEWINKEINATQQRAQKQSCINDLIPVNGSKEQETVQQSKDDLFQQTVLNIWALTKMKVDTDYYTLQKSILK